MWLPMRCIAFSFLLTILQILLICSSNFSSESKVIPRNFSVGIDAIDAFAKRTSLCVFELKITWNFSGLAYLWLFLHQSKLFLAILSSSEITVPELQKLLFSVKWIFSIYEDFEIESWKLGRLILGQWVGGLVFGWI